MSSAIATTAPQSTRVITRGTLATDVGEGVTDRLITAAELADRLALSTATVLDWFEAGRLPGFKLGRAVRFRESELLAWLEAQRVGPRIGAGPHRLAVR